MLAPPAARKSTLSNEPRTQVETHESGVRHERTVPYLLTACRQMPSFAVRPGAKPEIPRQSCSHMQQCRLKLLWAGTLISGTLQCLFVGYSPSDSKRDPSTATASQPWTRQKVAHPASGRKCVISISQHRGVLLQDRCIPNRNLAASISDAAISAALSGFEIAQRAMASSQDIGTDIQANFCGVSPHCHAQKKRLNKYGGITLAIAFSNSSRYDRRHGVLPSLSRSCNLVSCYQLQVEHRLEIFAKTNLRRSASLPVSWRALPATGETRTSRSRISWRGTSTTENCKCQHAPARQSGIWGRREWEGRQWRSGGGGPKRRVPELERAITETIEPDSWADMSGPGTYTYVSESGGLVIRQTWQVHRKILQLLRDLREAKRSGPAAPKSTKVNDGK